MMVNVAARTKYFSETSLSGEEKSNRILGASRKELRRIVATALKAWPALGVAEHGTFNNSAHNTCNGWTQSLQRPLYFGFSGAKSVASSPFKTPASRAKSRKSGRFLPVLQEIPEHIMCNTPQSRRALIYIGTTVTCARKMSAVTQSAPPKVEISGFKVHHFLGLKTALFERRKAARMGRVQLPESEFTNNCQKPLRAGMVVSPDCARTGD